MAAHFPELELLELIGAGGMGAVYKARQPKLDRLVALKILSRDLAGDPAFAERFNREARLLARLHHPNIVTVFDCGVAGPFAFLLLEFVDGVNLRQAMQTGRFKPAEALALVQDVCGALKFAHEKDILHRDIKPENILIDSRGQVKIADFGIAKLTVEGGKDSLTLTQRGFVLGSPHYMAPEQFDSPGDVDQRADIYSLGVVLYELLTGELPLGRFAPPSKKSAVDARIDEIVMRTLERERELRFQTVGEVKTRMEAATDAKTGAGAPSPDESRGQTVVIPARTTARFATASAVCTGISLLLCLGSIAYVAMVVEMSKRHSIIPGAMYLILAVCFVLTALPATFGLGFGVRALRTIRESRPPKGGFLRAMVGTLAWPSLLLTALAGLLIAQACIAIGLPWQHPLFAVVTLLVGAVPVVLLCRKVADWVSQGASPRGHGAQSIRESA